MCVPFYFPIAIHDEQTARLHILLCLGGRLLVTLIQYLSLESLYKKLVFKFCKIPENTYDMLLIEVYSS